MMISFRKNPDFTVLSTLKKLARLEPGVSRIWQTASALGSRTVSVPSCSVACPFSPTELFFAGHERLQRALQYLAAKSQRSEQLSSRPLRSATTTAPRLRRSSARCRVSMALPSSTGRRQLQPTRVPPHRRQEIRRDAEKSSCERLAQSAPLAAETLAFVES